MFTCEIPPKWFWENTHYVAYSKCTSLEGIYIDDMNEEHICQSEQVRCYISEDKEELELCYAPSYQTDNCTKIMYNNVCSSISRKQEVIMNKRHILGCNINIQVETWLSS